MADEKLYYYCEKCHKTMVEKEFYGSHNLEKYPEGKLNQCKKCITMHVDNWDPDTFMWILQECDVPYIPDEWHKLMQSYAQDKSKVTGLTIIGRYLSKMKLKQWKDYRWKDTAFLQELANHKIEETMKRQGYEAAEIAQTINDNSFAVPDGELVAPPPPPAMELTWSTPYSEPTAEEMGIELTDEDKIYLRLKWGAKYRPEEWIQLEQLYNDMMSSYDIQTAGHIDTLKLLCKTSLKANQLIDLGDVEGYQKMSKVYDSLMKSGKFTAQQNKESQGEFVDSVSELVRLAEESGFIPRYYVDGPQDKVDKVLLDTQQYVHNLVTEEMGLGNLIENAVKLLKEEQDTIRNMDASAEDEDEDLFNYDKEVVELSDSDYQDFADSEDELAALDETLLNDYVFGKDDE